MLRSPTLICVTALLLALVLCPAAAAENESVFFHINEGCDYVEARQYTKGIASFDRAIELEPGFSLSWYNRGVAFQEMRRYDEALESYNQAVALDPYNPDTLFNRGIVLQTLGRYEEALEAFEMALAIDPNDEVVRWHRDTLRQQQALQEMVFRWGMIGGGVVVGYMGYRVWKRRSNRGS
ncbi:tetratricopeptide (TPR) repeat protein [Methanocalculus sp. AMF5]|uniref:tetratricopeptide repeat protein n=1 Tax=Methanocalculus sp. AMF5 TaxID=1198257 RepID=UPI0020A01357|nr:tetratricopeptide repeat protein [Methanocalculus sp. AMF5]MCP1663274.1 tetratricopeptide (TPR) repeat protein [Methanocalculus sp. AMF5]